MAFLVVRANNFVGR